MNPSFTGQLLTLWSPREFLVEHTYHLVLDFSFPSYLVSPTISHLNLFVPSPTHCLTHRCYSMNICWMLHLPPNHLLLDNTEVLISKFKKRTYFPSSITPTKVCTAWVEACLLLLNLQLETYGDLEASHFSSFFFFPLSLKKPLKTSLNMSRNSNENVKKL